MPREIFLLKSRFAPWEKGKGYDTVSGKESFRKDDHGEGRH
jgi:hypothetical protein